MIVLYQKVKRDFELFSINENILKNLSRDKGHIGNLQVTVIDEDEEIVFKCLSNSLV